MAARLRLSAADCWAQSSRSFMAGDGRNADELHLAGAFPEPPKGAALAPRDNWYAEQTRAFRRSPRAVTGRRERERTR